MFLYVCLGVIVVSVVLLFVSLYAGKKMDAKQQVIKNDFDSKKSEFTKQYVNYKIRLDEIEKEKIGKAIQSLSINNGDAGYIRAIVNDRNQFIIYMKVYPQKAELKTNYGEIIPPKQGYIDIIKSYNISDILFWQEKGDVQYTTQVQGGGTNLKGAVMGSFYAGAAGAVIGSRQAVTTSTTTHDSREIIIKFKNGQQESCTFSYYNAFIKLMPTLEYTYIQMNK